MFPANRTLPRLPLGNGLRLLRRERRKHEVWIVRLPRECLGFIQSQMEQRFGRAEHLAEFGNDGSFCFLKLRKKFAAGGQASGREILSPEVFRIWFVVSFHIRLQFLYF